MRKINRFPFYAILFLALALEITVLNRFKIQGAKIDLMLIIVVFIGLFFGSAKGLEFGLVTGLLNDIFASSPFGINMFVFGMAGPLAGILSTKFFKESKTMQFLLILFITALSMLLRFLAASLFSRSLYLSLSEYFLTSSLPASLYTALASLPIFSKLLQVYSLKEDEELL